MMISLKTRGLRLPTEGIRCFSVRSSQCQKSHYDTLKISPNASQADVKSAYYKLSKQYHPDANINDPTATVKFQEISEAYEVLGNEDSRMRYDKGMAPLDRMASGTRKAGFKVPEDPRAAFYKSRLQNKMKVPTTGRIYNFDDWTKNHYSASIKTNRDLRNQARTAVKRDIQYSDTENERRMDKKLVMLEKRVAITLVSIFLFLAVLYELDQPDTPRPLK
ncbi:dnaJ homolog subfamily C member 30, mitochondrial-like [Thrips palmi]|uniref:DnaJ homolog subfamily C member 30, mitochondrial-like n=1 Tax=Thrips palmi TaxID=161013 RepID=A0A6P8Y9Y8_THRPL|nr:dnaJ homolog subfamily C member 30, mitochondrial-like [Thrips palmi]